MSDGCSCTRTRKRWPAVSPPASSRRSSTSWKSRSRRTSASPAARWASAVLEAIASSPARDSVDWSRIHFWWSDERYLPHGDADRNDTQSRAALLDAPDPGCGADPRAAGAGRAARHRIRGARVRGGARRCRARRRALPEVRRHVPRRRPGRARRLALPRPRARPRDRAGRRRRDRLAQAAARAAQLHPPGDQLVRPHLAGARRRRQGRRPRPRPGRRERQRRAGGGRRGAQAHGVLRRPGRRGGGAGDPDHAAVLLDARRTRSRSSAAERRFATSCAGAVVPRRARS